MNIYNRCFIIILMNNERCAVEPQHGSLTMNNRISASFSPTAIQVCWWSQTRYQWGLLFHRWSLSIPWWPWRKWPNLGHKQLWWFSWIIQKCNNVYEGSQFYGIGHITLNRIWPDPNSSRKGHCILYCLIFIEERPFYIAMYRCTLYKLI